MTKPAAFPPRIRHSARVLVLDANGRVLLFRISPDAVEHDELWIPPGGGLGDGEYAYDGAQRELREETGFSDAIAKRHVWTRRHISFWRGRHYDTRETYFVCRLQSVRPEPTIGDEAERSVIVGHRWWTSDEIVASEAVFAPRRLGYLLPAVVAGDVSDPPLHLED